MRDIDSGQIMRGNQMIDSIRIAAMEAIFFNLTGARFQLPHGGYGLTGVCNDSAAMIQYALSGKNDVYSPIDVLNVSVVDMICGSTAWSAKAHMVLPSVILAPTIEFLSAGGIK